MSNFLAIATVTATLAQGVQEAVAVDVPGATVTMTRPDSAANGARGPRVNLYLYQVTPNAAYRNCDLPTRRLDGQLVQRPRVALDLHYLLTCYGDEPGLEPQRLLGSVVRTLHAAPVLTRESIRDAVTATPALARSNLADEVELVKFTPIALSLEELSKLWSVFFQTQHALSVAYQGTVVLIEGEEAPRSVLPVRQRNLYVVPFRQPVIEKIVSDAGENEPIVANSTLVIQGRGLRGDATQVRIAGIDVTPPDVTDTQISLPLTSPQALVDSLRAGVQGLQVVQPMLLGTPPVPHRGVESNVAAFVLRPTITNVQVANTQGAGNNPRSADVSVTVNPKIGKTQRVILLLNEMASATPAAYTFIAEPRAADANTIMIPISGVKVADYLVRVQVDGAESILQVDTDPASPTFNQFIGPKATIP